MINRVSKNFLMKFKELKSLKICHLLIGDNFFVKKLKYGFASKEQT